jgi:cytochrome P450/ferredoxin-NADP reductase
VIGVAELPEIRVDELIDDRRLAEQRSRHWAARSDRGVEVLGYDQGMQVLEHPHLLKGPSFQYRLDQLGVQGEARRYIDMGITNKEGEERRQMRASMGALFRPSQVAKLRSAIREIARSLVDEVGDAGEVDLMRIFWEIPSRTYCELVSIPYSESGVVIRIADSVLGTVLNVDTSRREEAEAAILESVDIVRHHLNIRRGQPGDDFTSVMIRQQEDGLMTEEQLVAQSFALLQASVDNTAHQMGNTFGMLLSQPDRWRAFVADPALRGPIIEEAIRLHPRFGTIFRLAEQDVVIDDVTIPEGEWAFVSVRAAQRDPEAFEDPDAYRLDRGKVRPLMFGAGPYNCLGQNLARMEIEEAMLAVVERYPDLELVAPWERKQANAVSETARLLVAPGRRAVVADEAPVAVAAPVADLPEVRTAPTPETPSRSTLPPGESEIECRLLAMERIATDTIALTLGATDGRELPAWTPGSHIDLVLPGGQMRQYSLCGDPEDRFRYRIAVLREVDGTGGSAAVHDRLAMSDPVTIRGPRNNFTLRAAPSYHFVAGGIGITAILPMVREAERRGVDWTFVYLGRSTDRLAFLDEIAGLPAGRVRILDTGEQGRPAVSDVLATAAPGAHVYACGPGGLLDALANSGWPEDAVHFERFQPDQAAMSAPTEAFSVRLTEDGRTLAVPPERSILDVVEAAGVSWPYSCREGTCGTCEVRIVAGRAQHRDAVLTPAERRRNESMMICVSRAETPELELEI